MEATTLERTAAATPLLDATPKPEFISKVIPISAIIAGYNPRKYFDPQALDELTAQVKASNGIHTPIIVRELEGASYKLIAGARRVRATTMAFGEGAWIPASLVTGPEADDAIISVTENTQRQNMSPAEEAEAAAKLLGERNGDRDEVARLLGMSRATLDKRLALMNASDKVREALSYRRIDLGHAELLAGLTREKQDDNLAALLKFKEQGKMPKVDEFRALLQRVAKQLSVAIFDQAKCAGCAHNSDQQKAMFADALSEGHCTNAQCYDSKTEQHLQALYDGLEGEFPHRRIVRTGDNFTVVKLVVDGAKGVGAEQAEACKACVNYGAAIMATPDSQGRVVKQACFDTQCNAKMVAKRLRAESNAAAASAAPSDSKASTAAKGASASCATGKAQGTSNAPKAPLTDVTVSGQLEEFRKKLWRDTLRTEVCSNSATALRVLLAGAVCGQARNISGTKFTEHLKTMLSENGGASAAGANASSDIGKVLVSLDDLKDVQRTELVRKLVAEMVEDMTDRMVVAALNYLDVNLAKHFKLGEDLLKVLTKSEIEVMVKDIGLAPHLGDMKAFMAQKKADLCKKLLSIAGFDYSKVPSFLSLSVKLS
jgi:ParB family chromosome partitioning protein